MNASPSAGSQSGNSAPARRDQAGVLTLADLATMVWRWRYPGALVGVLVAAAVIAVTFRMEPIYQAEASLAVNRGRKAVEFQQDGDRGRIEFSFLNTERDRLLARPVLLRTLERAGLDDQLPYVQSQDPARILGSRITISTSRDSWVIDVYLRDRLPQEAERVLEVYLAVYLEWVREEQAQRAQEVLSFLYSQIDDRRQRLQEARDAELVFRNERGILSTDPDKNRYSVRLAALNRAWLELERKLAASTALMTQVAVAENRDGRRAATEGLLRIERIGRHAVVIEQQQLLFGLLDRRVLLGQKYGPKHPRMIEIEEQINTKRVHLDNAVDLVAESIRTAHHELELQAEELQRSIAAVTAELRVYREALNSLRVLTQAVETEEGLLEVLLQRQAEEEVTSRLEATRIQVFNPPKATYAPVNIRRKLFVTLAAFAGVLAGAGTGLLLGLLDTRVRTGIQAQEVANLPVWVQLPYVGGLRRKMRKIQGRSIPRPLLDSFQSLWASVLLHTRDRRGLQVLMVSSAVPGDGKSMVAHHLAVYLASLGRRVLLVDGDLRKPTLEHTFHLHGGPGLAELLAGEGFDYFHQNVVPGLDVLPTGHQVPETGRLLVSDRLDEALVGWRQVYDHIVFDTSPMVAGADVLFLAQRADGLFLVVRARHTTKRHLRFVAERLQRLEGVACGLVVNGVRQREDEYGYGYGYGGTPKTGIPAGAQMVPADTPHAVSSSRSEQDR